MTRKADRLTGKLLRNIFISHYNQGFGQIYQAAINEIIQVKHFWTEFIMK